MATKFPYQTLAKSFNKDTVQKYEGSYVYVEVNVANYESVLL